MATDSLSENAAAPTVPQINLPKLVPTQPGQGIVNQKRSIFDDDRSTYAGKITYQGYTFYFNPMDEEVSGYEKAWPYETSEASGLPLSVLLGESPFVTPEQSQILLEKQLELWNKILNSCLINWTANVPLTPERINHLYPDVKRTVAEAIIAFSKYGVGEEEFFRSRYSQNNKG